MTKDYRPRAIGQRIELGCEPVGPIQVAIQLSVCSRRAKRCRHQVARGCPRLVRTVDRQPIVTRPVDRETAEMGQEQGGVKCVTAIVLFDYPTRYGSTPSKLLDSRSCGHHCFHSLVDFFDVEGDQGSPLASRRTWLLYRHALMERSLLHPRDAGVSKGAS